MVVEVEAAFSNDENIESFEDTIHLEPGETANRDWVTKFTAHKTIPSSPLA
jgi:hypothetical protein